MSRIGLAIFVAIVAGGLYYLQLVFDRQRRYEELVALLEAAQPYKAEVEKALRTRAAMPEPAAKPQHARTMSARPDGTIVIEVSDELVAGARLTLRPEALPQGEYLWTCQGEGMRYAPAACR